MEAKFKITVPKPCHEDWNTMTPDETGRFCSVCTKGVVDFTDMKATEIQAYFTKNQGKRICGRFKNEQIHETFDVQIPLSVLHQQMPFHRAFVLALFVVMGSTLFSCKNHNDATLGEVSIVKDSIVTTTKGLALPSKDSINEEQMTLGKVDMNRYDSLVKSGVKMPQLPPPPPKPKKKCAPGTTTGDVALTTTGIVSIDPKTESLKSEKKDIYNLNEVDKKPEYPIGIWEFYEYFKHNFKVSDEDKNSTIRIFASFTINSDGSLSDIKILRGINEKVNAEALRVLKSCPKWIPAELKGKKVNVKYLIPIKITTKE